MKEFKWQNEVRAHEIDGQGIVNNAHYFSYFDHARTRVLQECGIDWLELSQDGIDVVLVHSDIRYYYPLRAFESFEVTTTCRLDGRIKLLCDQFIICLETGRLVCKGINTVVCVDRKRGKPVFVDRVMSALV